MLSSTANWLFLSGTLPPHHLFIFARAPGLHLDLQQLGTHRVRTVRTNILLHSTAVLTVTAPARDCSGPPHAWPSQIAQVWGPEIDWLAEHRDVLFNAIRQHKERDLTSEIMGHVKKRTVTDTASRDRTVLGMSIATHALIGIYSKRLSLTNMERGQQHPVLKIPKCNVYCWCVASCAAD